MENVNVTDTSDQQSSMKLAISKVMFDKQNPEMITKIYNGEIDKFSILTVLVKDENKLRKKLKTDKQYKIENNIYGEVINQALVFRCSVDGWRANQGEKIITSSVEEETSKAGLGTRLKSMLRG